MEINLTVSDMFRIGFVLLIMHDNFDDSDYNPMLCFFAAHQPNQQVKSNIVHGNLVALGVGLV
jgi:hypothetical protein